MSTSESRSYARGARILSIGIAATGVLTFAYFALASHVLANRAQYSKLDVLWSVMFVIICVTYRPVEQLLSRTIADRRARGLRNHSLRAAFTIQGAFALLFLAVALPLRSTLEHSVFGSATLYWILIAGVLAYAASYFARGWLAGHKYFGLYGGLVLMESVSRFAFALAAAVGITHGQSAIALGIAAAPFVSLVVIPAAFARRARAVEAGAAPTISDAVLEGPAAEASEEVAAGLSGRESGRFAISVSAIQLAEQTLLNAAVLTVYATSADSALPGTVFDLLLITRAPLQLFQAIQTSLLPHLAGLEATEGRAAFARAIRITVLAIGAFAAATAIALLTIGPFAMRHLFGYDYRYGGLGLAVVGVGMGLHLTAGTLNQAALARGQAGRAAALWLAAGALFVGWMLLGVIGDQVRRTEVGYAGAAGLLAIALWLLYRRGSSATGVGGRP